MTTNQLATPKWQRPIIELRRLVEVAGGQVVGGEYRNSDSPIQIRCRQGHSFIITYATLKRNKWCPECPQIKVKRVGKYTIEHLRAHAATLGDELLSTEFVKTWSLYQWKCKLGHIWNDSWGNRLHNKTICPACKENITIDVLRAWAAEKGGKFLSPEFTYLDIAYLWECQYGEKFQATWTDIRRLQNNWCQCKRCVPNKHGCIEDLREAARKHGGLLISEIYTIMADMYEWETRDNIRFLMTGYRVVNKGKWYDPNQKNRRKTLAFLQDYAKAQGGQLVSTEYINCRTYYDFICENGHPIALTGSAVTAKQWCPCRCNKLPKTTEELRSKAAEYGGLLLSPEYTTAREVYLWQCQRLHTFLRTWSAIQQDQWCRRCRVLQLASIKLEHLHMTAAKYDFKCLATEYAGADVFYDWQCQKGHRFRQLYRRIESGRYGCPVCKPSKKSYGEIAVIKALSELDLKYDDEYVDRRISPKRYDYLVNVPNGQLLIEFDGAQHFEMNAFFHKTEDDFIHRQTVDRIKTLFAWLSGRKLVRIDHTQINAVKDHIERALESRDPIYYSNPEMYRYITHTQIEIEDLCEINPELADLYFKRISQDTIPTGVPSIRVNPAPPIEFPMIINQAAAAAAATTIPNRMEIPMIMDQNPAIIANQPNLRIVDTTQKRRTRNKPQKLANDTLKEKIIKSPKLVVVNSPIIRDADETQTPTLLLNPTTIDLPLTRGPKETAHIVPSPAPIATPKLKIVNDAEHPIQKLQILNKSTAKRVMIGNIPLQIQKEIKSPKLVIADAPQTQNPPEIKLQPEIPTATPIPYAGLRIYDEPREVTKELKYVPLIPTPKLNIVNEPPKPKIPPNNLPIAIPPPKLRISDAPTPKLTLDNPIPQTVMIKGIPVQVENEGNIPKPAVPQKLQIDQKLDPSPLPSLLDGAPDEQNPTPLRL